VTHILPFLSIKRLADTAELVTDLMLGAGAGPHVLPLLKTPEVQVLIRNTPFVFARTLEQLDSRGEHDLVKAVLQEPFVAEMLNGGGGTKYGRPVTLWHCALGSTARIALFLSVPGIDLYKVNEWCYKRDKRWNDFYSTRYLDLLKDDEKDEFYDGFQALEWQLNKDGHESNCCKLDQLATETLALAPCFGLAAFADRILAKPKAFHNYLAAAVNRDDILRWLAQYCTRLEEVVNACCSGEHCGNDACCDAVRDLIRAGDGPSLAPESPLLS
jgi:hypothetical protein